MEAVSNRDGADIGIARMAALSGLSPDTLRWYEREGMLPTVGRGPDGRRRYSVQQQALVLLLARLRQTGMPASLMKEFALLVSEGAASHGRRVDVLERTRVILQERRAAVDAALDSLDAKVEHYRQLIDAGLDCDGTPVATQLRARQRSRRLDEQESA